MKKFRNVQSSNKNYIELEFGKDTVFSRSNPEKWLVENVDGEIEHVGWLYDEVQYSYPEFMEINGIELKDSISQSVVENMIMLSSLSESLKDDLSKAITELMMMISMGGK